MSGIQRIRAPYVKRPRVNDGDYFTLPDGSVLPSTKDEIELIERLVLAEAREDFWKYRQYIEPGMKLGWWQEMVAIELQRFYDDLIAGKRPYLLLQAPPQHGKSRQITEFLSWVAGKRPDWKAIFTSYAEDLGIRTNLSLQRIFTGERYQKVFPNTRIFDSNVVTMAGRPQRNSYILEYIGHEGSFRNTTVNGPITGMGLDLGVIDDPIKGRAEASSETIRNKAWTWLVDDMMTRFSEYAGLLFIMTRWHMDDPAGRFIEAFPNARVLEWPALATKDELFRKKGEPLFPEHKSLEFLLSRKSAMTQGSWESLYQQNPIIVGGGLFPIDKVQIEQFPPDRKSVKRSVRYWDKAGSQDSGAYTSGVLMHELHGEDHVVISDVVRGQWSYAERERRIKQAAEMDRQQYGLVRIWVEQEPGSGGKESAERTIANLRGFSCKADKVTGSKEVRAEPYAAAVQNGLVRLTAAKWNQVFLDEHESFPSGAYKDQVDAAAGAYTKLTESTSGSYDSSMAWVRG